MSRAGASRMSSVLGLKVDRECDGAAAQVSAHSQLHAPGDGALALRIHGMCGFDKPERRAIILASLHQGQRVLRKQDPPKPGPACRNLEPMRLSSPMPRATSCTSPPTALAEVSHLVDEGDLHGQEGVGRIT